MREISGPAMRELEPSAKKSGQSLYRGPGAGKKVGAGLKPALGKHGHKRPPEPRSHILVMAFRVAIEAPAEMTEEDLGKMIKHAHTVKEALALAAVCAIPACYCPAVDVEEIS